MKYSKRASLNKPNPKNKEFLTWSRAESCKHEDKIISSEWRETLKKTSPFVPDYKNAPINMVYLLSGEYGRIWQKERDEWYSQVFVLRDREKDMYERTKKIQKQIKEAKRIADISIKERKERRAKELEIKAKAEAEKAEKAREKVRAKRQKSSLGKKKLKKAEEEATKKSAPEPPKEEKTSSPCPENWKPVELTIQLENPPTAEPCKEEKKEVEQCEKSKHEELQLTGLCDAYYQQLNDIQVAKNEEMIKEVQAKEEEENKNETQNKCEQENKAAV